MLTYATEYCVIFVLLLVTAYVVPAGLFHYLFLQRRDRVANLTTDTLRSRPPLLNPHGFGRRTAAREKQVMEQTRRNDIGGN